MIVKMNTVLKNTEWSYTWMGRSRIQIWSARRPQLGYARKNVKKQHEGETRNGLGQVDA